MDKRISVILNEKLPVGIAFNSLAHMCLSLGMQKQEMLGTQILTDIAGKKYGGMSKYPIIILKGSNEAIKNISVSAKQDNNLIVIDFLKEMYDEYTDEEMKKAIEKSVDFEYYGTLLYGPTKMVNSHTKALQLWR
ncbi:MAG: DUF2000 domain-containing protein [Candidatus Micrarchaeota archaeon]